MTGVQTCALPILTDHVLHAHARGGIAVRVAVPLGVLAQRELDARRGPDEQVLRVRAPAQLDDRVAATDRVGGPVQDVDGGHPTRERTVHAEIGGIEQWVQIRGEDRDNPAILVLAGGPGNSLVPLTPVFRTWEQAFTVVQWDQRGAGRTYGRDPADQGAMTMDRMVRDGIELTLYLREHLRQPKIVLLGHSWGTVLGVLMTKRRPDLYAAYVGTGQVVAKEEKEEILYAALLEKVRAAHDEDGLRRLEEIGAPPYRTQQDLLVQRAVSERYDTDAERNLESELTPVVLFAPGYSLIDIRYFLDRKSTRLNSSHMSESRMPSSA